MPIYEFYCGACHTIFSFLARRVDTTARPACPHCQQALQRQVSLFCTIGRAKEDSPGLADLDEQHLERVLGELAREAEHLSEDDPQQMARLMRRFSEKSGLQLGAGMEEALNRMALGEDPEAIEQEMGDILDGEEPFALGAAKKGARPGKGRPAPRRDEHLYEL